ncbi:MAG: fibronectin type III domain-containing protein [Eubacterium sp.]|nr:fibronectin type III domain-containing protein [Eubacterium sp.]
MKNRRSLISAIIVLLIALTATVVVFADELITTQLTSENTTISLDSETAIFNGKEIKPIPKVVYKKDKDSQSKTLVLDEDYSLSYENNKYPGKAKIIISGIKDYKGSVNKTFKIIPQKPKDFKLDEVGLTSVKVSWKKDSHVSGYEVYCNGAGLNLSDNLSASRSSYRIRNLAPDKKYTIKIRAFVKIDSKKEYGKYTQSINATTVPAVEKCKVSGYCNLYGKPVVKWKKVDKAKQYYVYRSKNKTKGYKKIATLEDGKLSYTDKSAKAHKSYYYVVRGERKVNGKPALGRKSTPVKIKAKTTVLVGDSIMEGVKYYKALPGGKFVVKIGMGTYTFYERNYFSVGNQTVTGVEKVISYKPDRVFIMLGMNEAAYKGNKGIIEYYEYAIEDIKDACKGVEIVILPVSPTKANSGKSIPKKKRILSFNKAVKKMAKRMDCEYYDYTEPFKDSNGNLLDKYDGGDGCHWLPSSCKLFIKQLNKYTKKHK